MNPVAEIAFWTVLFVGSHLLISSFTVRDRIIAIVGAQPFRGIYSLIALGTFIPMIYVFGHNKHAGPMLWYLRSDDAVRALTFLLMFIALILFVSGLINPNPGAIGAPAAQKATGILKLTRHPGLVAFTLFGLAHMLMNGWLGDVIFFGGFPALGILGGIDQDRRKLRDLGESYRHFMSETSFLPGAALMSGRARWFGADMPWLGIGLGLTAAILLVIFHQRFFGASPFH